MQILGAGFRVQGSGFWVCRAQAFRTEWRIFAEEEDLAGWDTGCRVEGSGFWVSLQHPFGGGGGGVP